MPKCPSRQYRHVISWRDSSITINKPLENRALKAHNLSSVPDGPPEKSAFSSRGDLEG